MATNDHINMRILKNLNSGVPLVLGRGVSDWALECQILMFMWLFGLLIGPQMPTNDHINMWILQT